MSVKKIDVYNVGFGDCSLMELEQCNLLVDCGGSIDRNQKEQIKNDIINSSKNKNLECIITHFHEDHYNFLNTFPSNSLSAIYAPNFFSHNEIKTQLYILLLLSKNSESYYLALKMLNFIPNIISLGIIKPNALVHFVRKGDYINKSMEVLWPDLSQLESSKIIDSFENAIKDAYNSNNASNSRESVNTLEIIQQIESITTNILDAAGFNDETTAEQLTRLSESLTSSISIVDEIRHVIKQSLGSIKGLPTKMVKRHQNQFSIVFQELTQKSKISFLYLGDITKTAFEKNIENSVYKNSYKYIKTSHHGTKAYYTKHLPKCDQMIISNSKKKDWDITAMYPLCYDDRNFVCTNNNGCEFYCSADHSCRRSANTVCGFKGLKETLI